MQLREIKSFLNAFAKKVVDEAKANLKSQKKMCQEDCLIA